MFISIVEKFLLLCYKKKEIKLLDIYFSKLFEIKNDFDSDVIILYSCLLSLSSRLGNTCIPINKILNKNFFSSYILEFLFFFFKKYISIKESINILFKYNIISLYYNNYNTPFILYKECIYLHKFWIYETNIINFLKINLCKNIKFNKKKIFYLLNFIKRFNLDLYQKICILNVFFNKISIISGGPGTGKTTLITKLIIILYKIFNFKNSDSIIIVSYTGRSSSYLTNCINKNYNLLNIDESFKKRLPNKSITLHKFLDLNFNKKRSFINSNFFLDINILIIDESSMIDLLTFNYLCNLLDNKFIKIILLGDYKQIGAIESSSVFNEICKYNFSFLKNKKNIINFLSKYNFNFLKLSIDINKLNNNISFLIKNYRFNQNIYLNKFIILINTNNWKEIDNFLYNINYNNNFNFYDSIKFNYSFLLKKCIKNYLIYFRYIKENGNYLNFFYYLNKFQILSVIKSTKYGTNILNKYINNYFIKKNLSSNILINKNNIYYYGEPIIITKNNNNIKLFNGDICFFIFHNNQLKILNLDNNNYRIIYFTNIKYWDYMWSITVHKSQGSEYEHVFLVLPDYYSNILNKELIYTAITRSKKKISIYGNKDILIKSIKNIKKYYNNICKRLIE